MTQQPSVKQLGPYRCLKVMDSEPQSAVFLAEHETTKHQVVLRAITITVKDVEAALEQCKDVLAELNKIQAPNIVEIEDYGSDEATLCELEVSDPLGADGQK